MADVFWASSQLNLGNPVRRASIPSVYIGISSQPWPQRSLFLASDSSLIQMSYSFSIEDAIATDWELHS